MKDLAARPALARSARQLKPGETVERHGLGGWDGRARRGTGFDNVMFYTRPVTVGNPVPFRGGDPFFHLYGVAPMAAAVAACDLPLEP